MLKDFEMKSHSIEHCKIIWGWKYDMVRLYERLKHNLTDYAFPQEKAIVSENKGIYGIVIDYEDKEVYFVTTKEILDLLY